MSNQSGEVFFRKQIILILICFSVLCVVYFNNILSSISWHRSDVKRGPYLLQPNLSCNGFLIVVKSAVDEFKERTVIRNTWIPVALSLDMNVIFSVGYSSEPSVNDRLMDEAEKFGDILQINFTESYHRLTLKTYYNMKWITTYCSDFDYVFFTDSDVIVFPRGLLQLVNDLQVTTNTMVGHCWLTGADPVRDNTSKSYMSEDAWPDSKYPPYCSGGGGYITTGDVPEKLLSVIPNGSENWHWALKLDHLEDVAFTGFLRLRANVTVIHTNFILYNQNLHFDLCNGKTVSIHSFRPPDVFQKTYNTFMKKNLNCKIN